MPLSLIFLWQVLFGLKNQKSGNVSMSEPTPVHTLGRLLNVFPWLFPATCCYVCRICICCGGTKICNFVMLKKWEASLTQIFKGHLIMGLQSNVLIYIYIRKPLAWLCFQHQKSAEADEKHNFIRLFTSFQILSQFIISLTGFPASCSTLTAYLTFRSCCLCSGEYVSLKLLHLDVAKIPESLIIFPLLFVFQYQSNAQ